MDVKKLDKRRWKRCYEDDQVIGYELIAFCVALKRVVKVVYLDFKNRDGYTILLSTDTELEGAKVIRYYQLRFQIVPIPIVPIAIGIGTIGTHTRCKTAHGI